MANSFNRLIASGTSAGSTLVTIGTGKTWILLGLMVSNVSGVLVEVDVEVAGKYLAKEIPMADGSSLSLLDGKIVMVAGDTLKEKCSTDAGVDYLISYMEMT
jgi:hypothetical protein